MRILFFYSVTGQFAHLYLIKIRLKKHCNCDNFFAIFFFKVCDTIVWCKSKIYINFTLRPTNFLKSLQIFRKTKFQICITQPLQRLRYANRSTSAQHELQSLQCEGGIIVTEHPVFLKSFSLNFLMIFNPTLNWEFKFQYNDCSHIFYIRYNANEEKYVGDIYSFVWIIR